MTRSRIWPDCRFRYHDGAVPLEQADLRRRDRERTSRNIAWIAIGFAALAFGQAYL